MQQHKYLRRPPGPAGVPFFGAVAELRQSPLDFLTYMASFGPMAHAKVGAGHVYVISDALLIEEVLQGHYKDCIKDLAGRGLIPLVGQGLLTNEGESWRRHRKLAAPPLQPKRIASYADTMVKCTETWLARLRDDEVRDISSDMASITLDIVSKTLLGIDPARYAKRIGTVLDASMAYFYEQLMTPRGMLPLWIPTPARLAFRKAVADLDDIVYGMIERVRKHDRPDSKADHLLARLMKATDDNGERMSDSQLRDEAVTMLLAGHETTALTLSYAIYLLSEHPELEARVHAELVTQLGRRRARVEDMPKLPLLDAVVRETLRLYPPAYAVGREATQQFDLGGYTITAGSQIWMSQYVMQRSERYFREPNAFKPDRFLDGSTKGLPRFANFPFGGGPRVCIGAHFAQMEAMLVLATLLQDVSLSVVPGTQLELSPVITMRLARGLRAIVRKRRAAGVSAAA